MLARVLHDEARGLGVRLQLLSLQWPVRTDANAAHACSQWPSANGIGRRVLELLDRRDRTPAQAVITCTGPCPEDARPFDPPQATDSETALLTSRCLQDARTLLGSLSTASTSASPSKEDTHDRPTRR